MNGPSKLLLLLVAALVAGSASAAETGGFDAAVQPFFQTYCLRCHGEKKQKGDFRLDELAKNFADPTVAQKWGEVLFRIHAGEMPPKKEVQPSAQELGVAAEWILARIKEGESARMAKRGPVAFYRLSRDEYANTIYDLLGVHYDVNLPGAFNEDPRWHGFERIGSQLSLSPSHVDRYFKAAEAVLEQAFPEHQPKPLKQNKTALDLRYNLIRKRLEEAGIADKVRAPIWPGGAVSGAAPGGKESGVYHVRIRLSGLPGLDGHAPHLSVWNEQSKASIYDEDVIASEDQPVVIEFETFLSMPASLSLHNDVSGAFRTAGNHTLNVLNMGGSVFTNSRDVTRLNPTGYKLFDDDGHAIYPTLLVDSVEWEGPLVSEAELKKREGLVPKNDGDLAEARECLQRFATRAWRRPAADGEIDRYINLIQRELGEGATFPSAYRAAMEAVLMSKNFYYIEEGSPSERRDKVTDWELASRLSYFLWGSMPDDTLFASAQAGKLHEPDVMRTQFARMLADPKCKNFTQAFPEQWLQLYRVGTFPPDPTLYPDFDNWLEKSMVLESTEFFNEVFAKNLSLREFLVSDWTMVNPRLARHYQLPPLKESGFQRITLPPESHRGGLLTQAGILMLTSDGTRHRPVHRGVWVSEAIFGKTPAPPPPNVQPIEPIPTDKPKTTIRKQLEAHATFATCASCHDKIDPLGLAFDNFDAIGRWRTEEIVHSGVGANPPVDASGTLPDGRSFKGPDEFKQLMAQDLDRFGEAFVEQLATFALRRVMTIDDEAQIRAIAAASKTDGYKLRSIIENFVMSDLFLKR